MPVVLVGDIDRGGVIASLVGTQTCFGQARRGMIRGFVVNRMRGDASLFADGMAADRAAHGVARLSGWCRSFRARIAFPPRTRPTSPRSASGGGPVADRRPASAAYRQFRRSRPARGGAGRVAHHGRARATVAGVRPGHPARIESHHRRSARAAGAGLGHRSAGAPAPGRPDPRPVRRLPDAGPARRRPGRRRGAARRGCGAGPARHRHGADRRQTGPRGARTLARGRARRSGATKCMSA